MDGDRIARALARIEAAAGRIQTAAARPPVPESQIAADPGLALRYDALRREADAALGEIDALIAGLEA